MGFLRAAQVALVTPVRDGMNLVAKEFVAAQDPEDPGVLIISPMAGAARELTGALQVNPYDKRGMALALQTALHMPLDERRQRHQQMFDAMRAQRHSSLVSRVLPRSDAVSASVTGTRVVRCARAADAGWWQRTVGRLLQLEGFAERQILAVDHVHHVVVPALHFGLHEVLVHVEVQRHQRMVAQHHALGLLQQLAALRGVGFGGGAR